MSITVLAVITGSWALVMALSPLLQIRRMVKRSSSEDLSEGYFVVLIIGFALWASYGIAKKDATLIVPNIVAFVIATVTLIVARYYRTRDRVSPE